MNLCSRNHDEICHEGRECPVCVILRDHETAIEEKDSKITDLTDEVARLGRIETLQQQEYDILDQKLTDARGEIERLIRGRGDGEL